MAVTVTTTQPAYSSSTTLPRHLTGSYGPSGATNKTFSIGNEIHSRSGLFKLTLLVLSGTYITNGFALTPSTYGLRSIDSLLVVANGASGGAAMPFLSTTGNSPIVKLVTDNSATELANATSVTNHSYLVVLLGTPGV